MAVYRQLIITFQENGDVDYRFLRTSSDGNLTRYLIAYPAERVSVNGGENLTCDNFRSAITREGHVQLTWERGAGERRGIDYSKIGFLDVVQAKPLLLRYRESIRIRNERQPARRHPDSALRLARDAGAASAPQARDAGAVSATRTPDAAPLSRDISAASAPLTQDTGTKADPLAPWPEPPGLVRDPSADPLLWDAFVSQWRDQPNVFLLKVHDRNQRLSAIEERSEAVFHCTSSGTIHTCQAFLRNSHGVTRLVCSEHTLKAGQRLSLRPTELVGAQFMCAGVLSIDWILELEP